MKFIADLHIHSKYSQATSKEMDIAGISLYARLKGISLVGSGDFTHPAWLALLKGGLKEESDGLFTYNGINFILTSEVSNIFRKNDRFYKIHILIFSPSFSACDKINEKLSSFGSLWADGRPTLTFSARDLVRTVLDIDERCLLVPAHIWTPHFSLFGANSGFDSIEECFEDETENIHALETGLSSDPAMNWRLSALDRFTLISNSDAHSPIKLGREANVLDCKLDYDSIITAIKTRKGFLETLEFFPEEGKYHYDGHRNCNLLLSPKETKVVKGICPKCRKKLTVGVVHRVELLSDREEGFLPEKRIPYRSIVPLLEIIAASLGVESTSVKVKRLYLDILNKGCSEMDILLELSEQELNRVLPPKITMGVLNVRHKNLKITPGYDGIFGKVEIPFEEKESEQMNLF